MGSFIVKFKDRKQVAEGTMACYLEKPEGFEYAGGQSIDLTLLDPAETDAKGNTRALSLASAPHEPLLMVATRRRDTAFKRVLGNLPLGSQVKFEGPFGSMTLHRKAAIPAIILAGGIGITPFRSMLCQAANANADRRLYLFYSNRTPGDAPFLSELQELARRHPGLTLVATMTDAGKLGSAWNGEKGYITADMLRRHVGDLAGPIYYIAGPPAMVGAMKEMLNKAGVDEDDVNSEDFSGY